MKIRPRTSISPPDGPGAGVRVGPSEPVDRRPVRTLPQGDDVEISVASAALSQTGKVQSLTAAVGAGTYEASSTATSHALVEDALLKGI